MAPEQGANVGVAVQHPPQRLAVVEADAVEGAADGRRLMVHRHQGGARRRLGQAAVEGGEAAAAEMAVGRAGHGAVQQQHRPGAEAVDRGQRDAPAGEMGRHGRRQIVVARQRRHRAGQAPQQRLQAAIGGGAGVDESKGVLKPAEFSLPDGTSAAIRSIAWRPSAVEMRLEPRARLSGYHADFIAMDGSIRLRLDFDDASEIGEGDSRALSWPVCIGRWEAGDLMMLRISESPPGALPGATRDTECANMPTATPATPPS